MKNTTKNNWQTKTLEDICSFISRGISPSYLDTSGICVLNQKCIRNHKVSFESSRRHNEKEKVINTSKYIQIGDGLINSTGTGTLGRVALVTQLAEPTTVDSHITIIRPKPDSFDHSFFGIMLQTVESKFIEAGDGCGGQTELSRDKVKSTKVTFPESLEEQQRIVKILDGVFEGIEKAKQNTEKNLQNATNLFESYLQDISGPKENLDELVDIKTGKLNANAAAENGTYPFFTCSREILSINNYAFDCEAILLAGNNASGDFNVKHYKGKFNAYQRTYVITVNKDGNVLYRYLYYQLLNSLKEFKSKSVGANTKFLKLEMIKNLQIPLPPITEQKLIVEKLDALQAETKKLEENCKKKLELLDELKRSVLQKAFSGEL